MTYGSVRQGILRGVTNTIGGLEAGVLEMTHEAVITYLLRYALVAAGSCIPPDLFRRVNTREVNVASRKVGGLGRPTQFKSLHFTAETATFAHLYVRYCAEFLDACLRAHNNTIRKG